MQDRIYACILVQISTYRFNQKLTELLPKPSTEASSTIVLSRSFNFVVTLTEMKCFLKFPKRNQQQQNFKDF